jgi:hypothetical protein
MTAVEILAAGIHALAHSDASQLEELVDAARRARMPATVEEQSLAQGRLRAFGCLVTLTRRNLRLLRGGSGYGSFGDRGVAPGQG